MSAAEWTEVHQREAQRALLRMADKGLANGCAPQYARMLCSLPVDSEAVFRGALEQHGHLSRNFIDREVRRVRALAEGRLVRETENAYAVRRSDGTTPASFFSQMSARDYATSSLRPPEYKYEVRTVRAVRIRRAT